MPFYTKDTHGKVLITKVRHRRKTSPEQLKVLEHWFNINPKPDNHMREWLAAELGMTKRNIQVWFQNRYVLCLSVYSYHSRRSEGFSMGDECKDKQIRDTDDKGEPR